MIPIIDMESTGENIKMMRKLKGLSVNDVQRAMGFTNPQAVYRWESGKSLPTLDNLVILASVLNTTIDSILQISSK